MNSRSPAESTKVRRRLLSYEQLKEMGIPWSREHIYRLETKRAFPRRLYLSPQRVAWFEDEILEFLEAKAAERHSREYATHD